eukprot:SAG22_NODE_51_length_24458_cov_19.853161_7_plen_1030_part_00
MAAGGHGGGGRGPAAPRWADALCHALICVSVCATFGPTAVSPAGYISHDDPQNYVSNARIHSPTAANLRWIAGHGTVLGVYEPVALLFKLGWWTGAGGSARCCRMVSLALHSAVCCAGYQLLADVGPLYMYSRQAAGAGSGSWSWRLCSLGGLLWFAVHPLRVEVLCWASCQPYLLAAVFTVAAVAAVAAAAANSTQQQTLRRRLPWFALATLLYCCAVLSKAAAVPLPVYLLLLDARNLVALGRSPGRGDGGGWWATARWACPHAVLFTTAGLAARVALAANSNPQQSLDAAEPPPALGGRIRKVHAALGQQLATAVLPRASGLSLRYRWPTAPTRTPPVLLGTAGELAGLAAVPLGCLALLAAAAAAGCWAWQVRRRRRQQSNHRLSSSATEGRWPEGRWSPAAPAGGLQYSVAASGVLATGGPEPQYVAVLSAGGYAAWLVLLLPTTGLVAQHGQPILTADRYSYLPSLLVGAPAVAGLLDCVLRAGSESRLAMEAGAGAGAAAGGGGGGSGWNWWRRRRVALAAAWLAATVSLGMGAAEYAAVWAGGDVAVWQHVSTVDGADAAAHADLGAALLRGGGQASFLAGRPRADEALLSYQTALSLSPQSADWWADKAVVLRKLGRLPDALAAFAEATGGSPRSADGGSGGASGGVSDGDAQRRRQFSSTVLASLAWTNKADAELAAGRPLDSAASATHALGLLSGPGVQQAGDQAERAAAVSALVQRAAAAEQQSIGQAASLQLLEGGLLDLEQATALMPALVPPGPGAPARSGCSARRGGAAGAGSGDSGAVDAAVTGQLCGQPEPEPEPAEAGSVGALQWPVEIGRASVLGKLRRHAEAETAYVFALAALDAAAHDSGPDSQVDSRRAATLGRRGMWRLESAIGQSDFASRSEQALADCQRAASLTPQSTSLRANVGSALLATGRVAEAVAAFDGAAALGGNFGANAAANRAHALLETTGGDGTLSRGRTENMAAREAVASCDAALALDPGHAAARRHRARALARLQAAAALQRALPAEAFLPLSL